MTEPTQKPTDDSPETSATSESSEAVSRPRAPGAAAARRARQLGGARRPLPHPRPADDAAATTDTGVDATTSATAATAAGTTADTTTTAETAPPRRRPRPTATTSLAKTAAAGTTTAAVETDTDGGTDDHTDGAGDDASRPRPVVTALLVVLIAACLAVGAFFVYTTVTAEPAVSSDQVEQALSAAKTDMALVTTYGYQTVDADAAKAAEQLTGQFKTDYLQSIDEVVKKQLPTTQTVSTGQVDTAGLVSASQDGEQVVVLVYGQQSVTNKVQTTPRIDAFQVQVTLDRVDGRWLISQLNPVASDA